MSIRAWSAWSNAVIRIENDNGDFGTGVLVQTLGAEPTTRRYFFVTPSHVISELG